MTLNAPPAFMKMMKGIRVPEFTTKRTVTIRPEEMDETTKKYKGWTLKTTKKKYGMITLMFEK